MLTYQQIHTHLFEAIQALESNSDAYTKHHAMRALNMLEKELHDLVTLPSVEEFRESYANPLGFNIVRELADKHIIESVNYSTNEVTLLPIKHAPSEQVIIRELEWKARTITQVISNA